MRSWKYVRGSQSGNERLGFWYGIALATVVLALLGYFPPSVIGQNQLQNSPILWVGIVEHWNLLANGPAGCAFEDRIF
jgi:hypothetical protein